MRRRRSDSPRIPKRKSNSQRATNDKGRLKASALAYAILISLVLALMTLSMMMAFQLHEQRIASITDMHRSMRNANSGILLLLSDASLGTNGMMDMDLFGDGSDSVRLERIPWGGYQVLKCHSWCGQQEMFQTILSGSEFGDSIPSLVLADKGKPLALCGNTRISGDCYLPKAGMKRAYIEGKNYVGRELIYGHRYQSQSSISPVNIPAFSDHLSASMEQVEFEELNILTVNRSFQDPSLLIRSFDVMKLDGVNWSGNILVESESEIRVSWNAKLDGCILSAPKVIVESEFAGNFQVYADSVVIESNVRLEYPSGVYSLNGPSAFVSVGDNCSVAGQILLNSPSKSTALLKLGKDTKVFGSIINLGQTELKGKVHGQLQTEGFILRTPSATYENHLLDVTIGMEELPRPFGSYFREESENIQITRLK